MGLPNDTLPEAEQVLIDVYRKMSVGQRWTALGETCANARALHEAGVRLRNPQASANDVLQSWLTFVLECPIPPAPGNPFMDQATADFRVLREVAGVFSALGITYALGGSMASAIHGIARFTRDADLTVEPFPDKEAALVAGFGPEYYLSLPAIQEAIHRRSSFNIIHTRQGFKVDVFIRQDQPFELSAMARRQPITLPDVPEQAPVVISPEDLILFKLRWFRLGNESASQQWKDVLGILKVQAGKLDLPYLDKWAGSLGIADLWAHACQEAGT